MKAKGIVESTRTKETAKGNKFFVKLEGGNIEYSGWGNLPQEYKEGSEIEFEYDVKESKWTDNEGMMWFRIFWQDTINLINGYGLIYINQPGSLMEAAHSSWYYPKKINRKLPFWNYAGIHYRRKDQ